MNIQQIAITYDAFEDRVLMRINGDQSREFRLWLTRRLMLSWTPALEATGARQLAQASIPVNWSAPVDEQREKSLANFNQEVTARSGDFDSTYVAQPPAPELGSQPLLVSQVQMALLSNGNVQLKMSEKSPESADNSTRDVELAMPSQMTHALIKMMHDAIRASQWKEGTNAELTTQLGQDEALLGAVNPPKYLN